MKSNNYKDYIKYANICTQMMATISVATWAGMKLDAYFLTDKPWFLCLFALASTILSIYIVIKKII